jgi:hypothetical protein
VREARLVKKAPEEDGKQFQGGDTIKVKLHDGRIVDAKIRAVFQKDDETKLNIDYGHEETATIELWQVVK